MGEPGPLEPSARTSRTPGSCRGPLWRAVAWGVLLGAWGWQGDRCRPGRPHGGRDPRQARTLAGPRGASERGIGDRQPTNDAQQRARWTRGSRSDRAARGKAARAKVPLQPRGLGPTADRREPVDLLEEQAASRVPELVPVRYGRMLTSPFAFYRGAAYLMAADLAATPRSGISVQACGDAHVSNFGLFGSPERELLFDINDFDETLPGPWEWDVKRLGASLAVAGRNNGFSDAERREVITASVGEYRTAMREFASMRNLDVWYSRLQVREGLPSSRRCSVRGPQGGRAPRREGPDEGQHPGVRQVDPRRGRGAADRERSATHRARRGVADGRPGRDVRGEVPRAPAHLPSEPPRGSPAPLGGLPLRPLGAQGGRRRQRRHPRVDHPHARSRRRRSALPPGQGGSGLGARSLRRQEPIRESGSASGGGPAADAGRERHLPRMGTGRGPVRWQARFLHPAAARLEGLVATGGHGPARDERLREDVRLERWLAPTRDRATGSRSPRTSVPRTCSIARSRRSPRPTPIRTNGTIRRSRTRPRAGGSSRRRGSEQAIRPRCVWDRCHSEVGATSSVAD